MLDFAEGRTDLLVATTVVEVGIDVANATTILIEDADRFGLAQLHQLRGRVGRGEHPGRCILFGEPQTEDGARRLEALTQNSDGFRLAELDLEIRGEGSILGLRQAGPTDLRFARLARDRRELAEARHIARRTLLRRPAAGAPRARAAARRGAAAVRRPPAPARRMRIIAGTHRGRRISAPAGDATRPTADRVREALFSIVGPVDGLDVLDLFAGSGALGLEALSRGAASATLVERARPALACIRANAAALGLEDRVRVVARDWRAALARRAGGGPGLRVVPPGPAI